MAQEVQKTLAYKAELNLIEGVGHQENRIKEHTQVEKAWGSECDAVSNVVGMSNVEDRFASSWTLTSTGGLDYRTSGGDIIIPLAGPYLVQYVPSHSYTQTSYYYTLKIYADGKKIYSMRTYLGDWYTKTTVLNLGRKNKITASFICEFAAAASMPINLSFKKL